MKPTGDGGLHGSCEPARGERRADGDLERFKEFIETRRHPTGAWRGEVHEGEVHDEGVREPAQRR